MSTNLDPVRRSLVSTTVFACAEEPVAMSWMDIVGAHAFLSVGARNYRLK